MSQDSLQDESIQLALLLLNEGNGQYLISD